MSSRVVLKPRAMSNLATRIGHDGLSRVMSAMEADAVNRAPELTGRLKASMWSAVYVNGRTVWMHGLAPVSPPTGRAVRRRRRSAPRATAAARAQSHAALQKRLAAAPVAAETGIRGLVGNSLYYARFVHDGTVHMQAHPFLIQALTDVRREAASMIKAGIS